MLFPIISWYLAVLIVSFATFIIFFKIFKTSDKGYSIAKILGLVVLSYFAYVVSSLKIVNIKAGFFLGFALTIIISLMLFYLEFKQIKSYLVKNFKLIISLEAIFFVAFLVMLVIRAQSPEILGQEKFMDFAIVNSILRSEYVPIENMWYSGNPLNYYHFGHFMTAGLITLSSVSSGVGYNLMIATLFALCVLLSFSLVYMITKKAKYGLLAAFMTCLAGNLNPFIQLLRDGTLLPFNYWPASRIIQGTINEFPFFSFIHADLHAHVLAMPIFIGFIFAFYCYIKEPENKWLLGILGFLMAVSYITSSWDVLAESLIFGLYLVYLLMKRIHLLLVIQKGAIFLVTFIVFAIPGMLFVHNKTKFKIVAEQSALTEVLIIYAIFFLFICLYSLIQLRKFNLWSVVFLVLIPMSYVLGGIKTLYLLFALLFIYYLYKSKLEDASGNLQAFVNLQVFVNLLVLSSILLLLFTEVFYVDHFFGRMNTVFKLGIHAWFLLGIATPLILYSFFSWLARHGKSNVRYGYILVVIIIVIGGLYPALASYSKVSSHRGSLDGTEYLLDNHPDEKAAIEFLNKNIKGRPLVLEEDGADYQFSNLISSYTGLPTVLGWSGHVIQWNTDKGLELAERAMDIETIYTSDDLSKIKRLVSKYNIEYIYLGPDEKREFGFNEILLNISEIIYDKESIVILHIK